MNNKMRPRYSLIVTILFAALIAGVLSSFFFGRYPISAGELFRAVFSKILPGIDAPEPRIETIFWNIRTPRILLACIVGCGLSAAGGAYQGVFQNPMASPDILGATSGAAFGAALAILLRMGNFFIMIFAFAFSIFTVFLAWFISSKTRGKKILGLILSGIMISSLFTSGTSFIKLVADPSDQLPEITYWLMGSLAGAKKSDLIFIAVPMAAGLLILFFTRWKINILTLGDDEARTMGVNTKCLRMLVILASTIVTAAAVSVSGMIGWVGLVIPHLCRRLVGNNYKHLMPASMLMGAIFLLAVDNISRNLLAAEIPIGILTSFLGAPFFIYLITREGERY